MRLKRRPALPQSEHGTRGMSRLWKKVPDRLPQPPEFENRAVVRPLCLDWQLSGQGGCSLLPCLRQQISRARSCKSAAASLKFSGSCERMRQSSCTLRLLTGLRQAWVAGLRGIGMDPSNGRWRMPVCGTKGSSFGAVHRANASASDLRMIAKSIWLCPRVLAGRNVQARRPTGPQLLRTTKSRLRSMSWAIGVSGAWLPLRARIPRPTSEPSVPNVVFRSPKKSTRFLTGSALRSVVHELRPEFGTFGQHCILCSCGSHTCFGKRPGMLIAYHQVYAWIGLNPDM